MVFDMNKEENSKYKFAKSFNPPIILNFSVKIKKKDFNCTCDYLKKDIKEQRRRCNLIRDEE